MNNANRRLWSLRAREAARRRRIIRLGLIVVMGLGANGCAPDSDRVESVAEAPELENALARARSSTDELGSRLATALGEQLASGSAAAAIDVCLRIAPPAATDLSRDGIAIRRISLRYRNPANAPDTWERTWLERFEDRYEAGDLPTDTYEVDEARSELRYLRPIVVGSGCLQCHGAEEELNLEVREQLALRYPDDKATGFSVGDLRGAFSVRVRMDSPSLERSR